MPAAACLCAVQEGDINFGDDDEDDAELDDTIVRDFHFGGGFVQKRKSGEAEEGEAEPRKSKKEVCAACACNLLRCLIV